LIPRAKHCMVRFILSSIVLSQNVILFLGLEPPSSVEVEVSYRDDLTDEQNWLLGAALSAKDYFLIQGPPGTGKTSYMLRAIVESIYTQTEETILITAYTNRAVDEICSSLKKSAVDIPFIRLGLKSLLFIQKIFFIRWLWIMT
jgi:superfamily I DNA and/or RNA helicase